MRAAVDAKEFSQALDKVSRAAKRSIVPELEDVQVQIAGGRCTLTGTDMTTWLAAEIPARGDDLGFVFLRTRDAVRACRHFEGELVLELTEVTDKRETRIWLTMACGPREAKFQAAAQEDLFQLRRVEPVRTFTVNAARLLERIDRVKYALGKPDPKSSVFRSHVQFNGSDIYAVDGYRLAWDTDPELHVPVPFMTSPEALEHLKFFGDKEVSLSFDTIDLQITDGSFTIQTRYELADSFDLRGAVPKDFFEEFYVYPSEFLRELAYLKEFAPDTGKNYVLFSGGRLSMTVYGESYASEIQLEGTSQIPFGFDLRHMTDALRQFKKESRVRMKAVSPVAPIVLEAENRGDRALILPVRMKAAAAA